MLDKIIGWFTGGGTPRNEPRVPLAAARAWYAAFNDGPFPESLARGGEAAGVSEGDLGEATFGKGSKK